MLFRKLTFCFCTQRQPADGERRDARLPGGSRGSPGRAEIPGDGSWRITQHPRQGRNGPHSRRCPNGMPVLSPMDGKSITAALVFSFSHLPIFDDFSCQRETIGWPTIKVVT